MVRILVACLICLSQLWVRVPLALAQTPPSSARIEELISQLGATKFHLRERAERELASVGLLAFEALRAHRNHEDIEIRLRARRLVEKLREQFLSENVDPALTTYIDGYSSKSVEAREAIVAILTTLLPQQAINELSRIARFDEDERLSKLAALAIMSEPLADDLFAQGVQEQLQQEYAQSILNGIGYGERPAIRWLRAYANSLAGAGQLAETWSGFLATERSLDATDEKLTSVEVVDTMMRLSADFYQRGGELQRAREIRKQISVDGFAEDRDAVNWLRWLQDRRAWDAIVDFYEAQPRLFEGNAALLYGVAEAVRELGREPQELIALLQVITEKLNNEDPTQRYAAALFLETERGAFDWAEREYRTLIDDQEEEALTHAAAYSRLAEMLHNQGQEAEAAAVLTAFLKRIEESEVVRINVTSQMGLEVPSIRSRMHYFAACDAKANNDLTKEKEALNAGFEVDSKDADLLIAMYRYAAADESWKNKTSRAIREAVDRLQREIRLKRRRAESAEEVDEMFSRNRDLASSLNHFAWLVSNTEGDYQEALRLGRKSLELEPGDSGIMDTVARCYYSVSDLPNALKYQRWAVARSPFESQLRKQLEFFEASPQAAVAE